MTSNTIMADNRYGALAAEVYDIDKPVGSLPDARFHLDRFKDFDRPILEPACGSGRILAPFAAAGLDITGFDRSPEMLQRCRARCEAVGVQPDLSQQSLEDFRYGRKFGAILMPVGTFTLIDEVQAARAVLRRLRDALEPGGVLVLDLPSLAHLGREQPDRRCWTAANGDLITLEGARIRTDWVRQRSVSLLRYERWRDHRLIDGEMERMVQRHWGADEFRRTLEAEGFEGVEIVGGYDRSRTARALDSVLTVEAVSSA